MENELSRDEVAEMIEREFGVKRREVESRPSTAESDFTETVEIIGDGQRRVTPNPDLPLIDVTVTPENVSSVQPAAPAPMMRKLLIGGGIATVVVVGGAIAYRRMKRAGEGADTGTSSDPSTDPAKPTPKPTPKPPSEGGGWWTRVPSLPTAEEVPGFDLTKNWGKTPTKMRPLFALMEQVSKIQGSARIFALIAKRESDFVPTAPPNRKRTGPAAPTRTTETGTSPSSTVRLRASLAAAVSSQRWPPTFCGPGCRR